MLIIFLGPCGSGKTTQAILLKRKLKILGRYRVAVTEGVHFTILLRIWYKLLIFLTRRRIRYRFRREGLVEEFVESSLLARMFRVDFVVNLVSAVISSLKISHPARYPGTCYVNLLNVKGISENRDIPTRW